MRRAVLAFALAPLALAACAAEEQSAPRRAHSPTPMLAAAHAERTGPCADEMARVDAFCIDKWEAHVVELDADDRERPHSPFLPLAEGTRVRAKSAPGVVPQGYVSQVDARAACVAAGKRLCTGEEFVRACRGPTNASWYPYGGRQHERGRCNEGKGSSVTVLFGYNPMGWTYANFNDARLNQMENTLAKTGEYERCATPEGVYDLVGNLHEWVEGKPDKHNHVRFRGGSFGDAEANGPGCLYVTTAHESTYHD